MVMTEAAPDRVQAALQGGDPLAAERLVAHYGHRAYRLAIGITCNPQDAEEAVQDAFWSVIRNIGTFGGDAALGSWIYRIVFNAAYQKVRGRARRRDDISLDEVLPAFNEQGHHADSIADWSTAVGDPSMESELRTVLTAALDELPRSTAPWSCCVMSRGCLTATSARPSASPWPARKPAYIVRACFFASG